MRLSYTIKRYLIDLIDLV